MNRQKHIIEILMVCVCMGLGAWAQDAVPADAPKMPPKPDRDAFQERPQHRAGDRLRAALEQLKEKDPQKYAELEELRQKDRDAYFAELRKLFAPQFRQPRHVSELERTCFELSRQYQQARTDEEKAAIKKELEEAVHKRTDEMIADLKKRLEMMNKQLETMEKNREEIVQKQLERLMNPPPCRPGKKNAQ